MVAGRVALQQRNSDAANQIAAIARLIGKALFQQEQP